MRLIVYGVKEDSHPVGVFHLPFEYSTEVFKGPCLYDHIIPRRRVLIHSDKSIRLYSRLNNADGRLINRNRGAVETDQIANPPCETDLVV